MYLMANSKVGREYGTTRTLIIIIAVPRLRIGLCTSEVEFVDRLPHVGPVQDKEIVKP
jgi:hypothetical protein